MPADAREDAGKNEEDASLGDLLQEARLLLPGSEVFLAFLMTLPFSQRFGELGGEQVVVYLCTFFAALGAFAFFVAPAAYHRQARPIHDRVRFKAFATRMLVVGLVPMSISIVFASYLVTSMVTRRFAWIAAAAVAALIGVLWWLVPALRLHDRAQTDDERRIDHDGNHEKERKSWRSATAAETTTTSR